MSLHRHYECHEHAKSWVFRQLTGRDGVDVTWHGKTFQIRAAAIRKVDQQRLSHAMYGRQVVMTSSDTGCVCVQQLLERRSRELDSVIGRLMKDCLLSEEVQEEIGRGLGLIRDTVAAREVTRALLNCSRIIKLLI